MKSGKSKKAYYYSGGKRVMLEPATDVVALNEALFAEKFPDLSAKEAVGQSASSARADIRLVPRGAFASDTLLRLKNAGVTQTVFQHNGANLVVLPEIRVEDDSDATLAEVRKFAMSNHIQIADEAEGRLTLRLSRADPSEAILLAAELVENHGVTSATPRFLRLVPRPVS